MDNDRADFWNGLAYYIAAMICVCSFYSIPDGDTLFYKLLKLLSINPGIPLGTDSTLYIYQFIPLVLGVICIKKVFKYWWGYGQRFAGYRAALRYMPLFIAIFIFLVPQGIESVYYRIVGSRGGLKSVVHYITPNSTYPPLSYDFIGNKITFSYDLTLQNFGDNTQEFQIKLTDDWARGRSSGEALIMKENHEPMIFTLLPRERQRFTGKFTDVVETGASSGSGSYSQPSLVLQNEAEQYIPMTIKKLPRNGFRQ